MCVADAAGFEGCSTGRAADPRVYTATPARPVRRPGPRRGPPGRRGRPAPSVPAPRSRRTRRSHRPRGGAPRTRSGSRRGDHVVDEDDPAAGQLMGPDPACGAAATGSETRPSTLAARSARSRSNWAIVARCRARGGARGQAELPRPRPGRGAPPGRSRAGGRGRRGRAPGPGGRRRPQPDASVVRAALRADPRGASRPGTSASCRARSDGPAERGAPLELEEARGIGRRQPDRYAAGWSSRASRAGRHAAQIAVRPHRPQPAQRAGKARSRASSRRDKRIGQYDPAVTASCGITGGHRLRRWPGMALIGCVVRALTSEASSCRVGAGRVLAIERDPIGARR